MKQLYDEKRISELYEDLVRRIRSGERMDILDQNMGIVTGHALDALELSKDIGHPLNLFELSEERINAVIIAMYMYFSKAVNSSTKCRETVTKKIGAYLFFAVCNTCNQKDELEASPMAKGSSLYLEIRQESSDNSLLDVFSPTERFIKNNLKYDKDADTMIIKDPEGILRDIKAQLNL